MKQEAKFESQEEGIFEMDDLDHAAQQLQSIELSSVDGDHSKSECRQAQTAKDSSSVKSNDENDTEEGIEITLSGSESESASEPTSQTVEARETCIDSPEKGCHSTEGVNSSSGTVEQDVVYRYAFLLQTVNFQTNGN